MAWSPSVDGIREVFHARNLGHTYPTHVHDTWTVFVVDTGAIHYRLDQLDRSAPTSAVTVLPPGVPHDGRPSDEAGFNKRVLYIEPTLLPESLVGHAVDAPAIIDPILRSATSTLHRTLLAPDDDLEAETLAALMVARIASHLTGRQGTERVASSRLADAFRCLLDEHLTERFTLADAGAALRASPTHLARSFAAAFSIPPHQYVVARRVDAARARILAGQPLADIAQEIGFVDQAHMTRAFRQHTGITPGQLAHASKDRGWARRGHRTSSGRYRTSTPPVSAS